MGTSSQFGSEPGVTVGTAGERNLSAGVRCSTPWPLLQWPPDCLAPGAAEGVTLADCQASPVAVLNFPESCSEGHAMLHTDPVSVNAVVLFQSSRSCDVCCPAHPC